MTTTAEIDSNSSCFSDCTAFFQNAYISLQAGFQACSLNFEADASSAASPDRWGSLRTEANRVANYIENEWWKVLLYAIAWGVIIGGYGGLYGFDAVAYPLAIGMAGGFGVGIISGILTVTLFDPKQEATGRNTLWDLLNLGLIGLDEYGTRQIIMTVAVSVLLAAATVFPYAVGGLMGAVIGNQFATKIGEYPLSDENETSNEASHTQGPSKHTPSQSFIDGRDKLIDEVHAAFGYGSKFTASATATGDSLDNYTIQIETPVFPSIEECKKLPEIITLAKSLYQCNNVEIKFVNPPVTSSLIGTSSKMIQKYM